MKTVTFSQLTLGARFKTQANASLAECIKVDARFAVHHSDYTQGVNGCENYLPMDLFAFDADEDVYISE